MFPVIEHLDDILPHISLDCGIGHHIRDGYQVLDYSYVAKTTFDTALARECRGLKFDATGRVIARPFHKFFNLGEKQAPETLDFTQPHQVMEKRDGSMVHPAMVAGQMVFMTRMGGTAQADLAMSHATPNLLAMCRSLIADGITPIFEFTSEMNRVVLAYNRPSLTLLAGRDMTTGAYLTWAQLQDLAGSFAVPLVRSYRPVRNIDSFVKAARALSEAEGYVIAFECGHRIKIKSDGYVLRHKALSGLRHEKNVLAWIAAGAVDDVLPLLRTELRAHLRDYSCRVEQQIADHSARLLAFHQQNGELPRKDYAIKAMAEIDPCLTKVAFAVLDGRDARDEVMKTLAWGAHSETRVDKIRKLIGAAWDPPALCDLEG